MEKIIRKYGVLLLLYLVVVAGAVLLSSRLRYLNDKDVTMNNIVANVD